MKLRFVQILRAVFKSGFPVLLLLGLPYQIQANTWVKHVVEDDFETVREVDACDIDGDGDIDIAAVARDISAVGWWENIGGSFVGHEISHNFYGAWSVAAADIDRDGDGDVFAAGLQADAVNWWENTPGGWLEHEVIHMNGCKGVHLSDMNNDKKLDVIGAAAIGDRIALALNEGNRQFTVLTVAENVDGVRATYAADLNGDGKKDIIASAGRSGTLLWFEWLNGGFIQHLVFDNYEGARGVSAGDIDLDGDLDIVSAARYEDEVTWWENKHNGQEWVRHPMPYPVGYPRTVETVDMDFDGDLDVACSAFRDDALYWFENQRWDQWVLHTIAIGFDGPNDIHIADMDLDGDYDAISAGNSANQIGLWESVSDDAIQISLVPLEPGHVYTQGGGSFGYDLFINTDFHYLTTFQWWIELTQPGGRQVVVDTHDIEFDPGEDISLTNQQWPLSNVNEDGDYKFTVKVGKYPDVTQDQYSVKFTVARSMHLRPCYPNPFNSSTQVELALPQSQRIALQLYNIRGQLVDTIYNGELSAGNHAFQLNGTNLASGVYFVEAESPTQSSVVKVTVMK